MTHKQVSFQGHGINMSDVDLANSKTLDVLGISIISELRWDDHILGVAKEADKCLGFLKRYNLWAGASKSSLECLDRIQNRAVKLIGDGMVSNSITFFGHRRSVGCVVQQK